MAENPRIEELRRRVQLDPASIAFAALAEEYRRAGRFEEAIATCTSGLVRHPSYLSAHVTLGRSLLEVKRYDEAQQELEYVLRLAPENLAAIRGLAEIHRRRGEETAAADGAHVHAPASEAAPHPVDDFSAAIAASAPPVAPAAAAPAVATPDGSAIAPPAPVASNTVNPPGVAAPPEVESAAVARLESFLSAIQRARAQMVSR